MTTIRKSTTRARVTLPVSVMTVATVATRRTHRVNAVRYDASAESVAALHALGAHVFLDTSAGRSQMMCWQPGGAGWCPLPVGSWVACEPQSYWAHATTTTHPPVLSAGCTGPICATCEKVLHRPTVHRLIDPVTFDQLYDVAA